MESEHGIGAPYQGITLCQHPNYLGKNSLYRFHFEDPDYSSTAYWYQSEPHKAFPKMLPVEQRLPHLMNIPRPIKTGS